MVNRGEFNVQPRPARKTVFVSNIANFEHLKIEREIFHELVRVIRYENNRYNQIKPSKYYLPKEEGLARLVQDSNPKIGRYSYYEHPAEYMASNIEINGSLLSIYDFFISVGFSEEFA